MRVQYPKLRNMAFGNFHCFQRIKLLYFICCIKVGYEGVFIAWTCFPDDSENTMYQREKAWVRSSLCKFTNRSVNQDTRH